MHYLPRREFMVRGGATLVALASFQSRIAYAFPTRASEEVIKWLDQLPPNPVPQVVKNQLVWEDLDSWVTPNDKFFSIAHFNRPVVDESTWKLEIGGSVKKPTALTLADIKARPRQEVTFTVECSGNTGLPFFNGGIGNARWAGTPLAPILEEVGVLDSGIEVVFWGTDKGEIKRADDVKFTQNFARSMSLADALDPKNILCYEMNGTGLPADNGFPLRLIAPGWYGIANVKWLKRIEVRDQRFVNQFMGRDYVTLREEEHNGETVWVETSVGRARLKSAPARVTHIGNDYRIVGAAWGAPIERVEVKIDDGPWMPATIDETEKADFAWKIWSIDWPKPSAGEHTVTSRAVSTGGQVQPAMDDPIIAKKHTYWESNGQVTRRIGIH
ncbi:MULTISPECIES: sulfite oxidase [unclassified Mesorhizobium]|uniref:sulfite oxidase n=1 Tax=unclassified Mesorhizobium TaxID=325217 RepID=UPI000BB09C8F|nr:MULTISPECIES: sulfite oxidase [unclassified Mesorhizobium]PBB85437.1 sulfite oxidase [Mesorhizobium sp. WSM3876]RWB71680.1 MAG: sulfite oxidase [Mesorhizobium sp.]RWB85068.1 MAG: sulfite oxidase [Mesorhizobium sp.]RWE23124.1 MAG: sulfite oxidase [Mesorhizobium sp.]RWE34209.1 MAG: sulfite oxidase [Mesorhizobium sp.]